MYCYRHLLTAELELHYSHTFKHIISIAHLKPSMFSVESQPGDFSETDDEAEEGIPQNYPAFPLE